MSDYMTKHPAAVVAILAAGLVAFGCSSDDVSTVSSPSVAVATSAVSTIVTGDSTGAEIISDTTTSGSAVDSVVSVGVESGFTAEVWADNWFALYIDGELVGEDSVPITTERSFNAETIMFTAEYPFTVAIEAKDFKETDSGIEYIGEGNQQMGDGGLIVQITDDATGEVVMVTDASWSALVIHRAPLNAECEKDVDPDATCQFERIDAPDGWTSASFDDTTWPRATEWSVEAVSPKDGYDQITWEQAAALVWGSDLEVDNTVLLRRTVSA